MAANDSNRIGLVDHCELSDIGLRRANNQDAMAVAMAGDAEDWSRRGHLFMVADGMGAHAAGERASELATRNIPHTYRKLLDRSPQQALHEAIDDANKQIHKRGQESPEFHGMGTTSSVLVLLPVGAVVAHVGDSRVYRLRKDKLEQLTFDHSLVWEMMAAGQIPRGESTSFPPKNIITRSLGPHPHVQVDLEGPFALAPGDTFLLCSDGLSGQVSDTEIGMLLAAMAPNEAARTLVDLANLRGGPDNITVIIARVREIPEGPMPAAVTRDEKKKSGSAQNIAWLAMGVLLLVAAGLAATGQVVPAVVSALGAAAAVVAGLLLGLSRGEGTARTEMEAPLGSAPYQTAECAPSREFAASLAQTAEAVRQTAEEGGMSINWDEFERLRQEASEAVKNNRAGASVRLYGLAISTLMRQIRPRKAS